MNVELVKTFRVEAAHRNTSSRGAGARLHGHTFRIGIVAQGEVDPVMGWLIDYGDIKSLFRPILDQLDHHYLNEIPGMGDGSLEAIAAWIDARFRPALPCLKTVRVSLVGENAFRPVVLDPSPEEELPRRLRFSFEAAQQLPHLPETHPCRRLHGHSYRVEVAAGNLDRLTPILREIHQALDHRYLNEIEGLEDATSERLCEWIAKWLARTIDDVQCIVVQETQTARCIYHGR
jgi:6-pyruvoyltetrahydropterin/6-carboxytetrahydropterin synthase